MKKTVLPEFASIEEMMAYTAEGVRPAERLTVSQAAERYRVIYNPGSYVGPWRNETTPYLVEFMDVLTSEDYTGAIFVGPAQSGKSDCALNWLTHGIVCDPMDMMFIDKSMDTARVFSMTKLDRLHEHSPEVAARLRPGRDNDNLFDRRYKSGMILTVTWPTKNNLSGKSIAKLWLADYDRMPQDIDGEGSPYWLAKQRTRTFGRYGMTVAESSPSFPVDMVKWVKQTPHEAAPSQGILALYNQGDRRRWLWRCVKCHNAFEPDFKHMKWPDSEDIQESAAAAWMECPTCGARYTQEGADGLPGKHEMNRKHARWIKDGMVWTPSGEVTGEPYESDIASFWLKGPAATFASFESIVSDYLKAERTYLATGEESELQTVVNTTLALPYIPRSEQTVRSPEQLRARAKNFGIRVVPPGVRFLVATIDLQKNRFVVQVHGIGSGENGEPDWWIVDRFDIRKSRRRDEDGDRSWVNLATHPEDWRQLTDEVLLKTYPLGDGSGRHMAVKMVMSDSAGSSGFTTNAYEFVRWLRRGDETDILDEDGKPVYVWEPGLAARYHLLRGATSKRGPRVRLTYPDAGRKDKYSAARGEIPVWEVNTQVLKDKIDAMLDRTDPGGRIQFPDWLPKSFYRELTVEVKDPKKGWHNPKNYRNESWDLLVYNLAALLTPDIAIEQIDWKDPPPWAREWDENDMVFDPDSTSEPFEAKEESDVDLTALGKNLG